jgi:hypothetical protein
VEVVAQSLILKDSHSFKIGRHAHFSVSLTAMTNLGYLIPS